MSNSEVIPSILRLTYAKDFSLTCNYVFAKSGIEVCVALIFAIMKIWSRNL